MEILDFQRDGTERQVPFVRELYLVCTLSGLLTFGMALYSALSLRFSFKMVIFQFIFGKIYLKLNTL